MHLSVITVKKNNFYLKLEKKSLMFNKILSKDRIFKNYIQLMNTYKY